jgi:CheY-like chemotaxis protein/HPt (histidine-containing phosphotransfer) domain-containing protein/anti-sigma regulatory factor (Ser/Thr protein kinase)
MHCEAAADIPKAVKGDAGRLRQVLINVASNAVKFTSHGHVDVRLACARQEEGKVRLEWTVSDTGIGIEPDRIQSIFREFVQADTTIQRRFGGSGLGLAICKRIIDRMGGEIAITSRPGFGTTVKFAVTLPLADEGELEVSLDDDCMEELHEAIGHLGTRLRLLVVDDNKTIHVVTARLLRHFDIDIDHAHDGTEGLTAARQKAYHVILMDTQMPGVDGLAATRALRSSKGPNMRTRVIAFTANAMREDVAAAMAAGSDDVVTKPVRKHELVGALLRALADGDRPVAAVTSAPNVSEDAPTFDATVYNEFVEQVGDDAIDEIVGIFIEETDARLARLDEMHGQPSKIGHEAHTLKSSAATLGLTLMAREAMALESEAASSSVEDLEDRVARLRRAYRDGIAGIARGAAPAAAA